MSLLLGQWSQDKKTGVLWSKALTGEDAPREHRWDNNTCPKCHGCTRGKCDVHPACICSKGAMK